MLNLFESRATVSIVSATITEWVLNVVGVCWCYGCYISRSSLVAGDLKLNPPTQTTEKPWGGYVTPRKFSWKVLKSGAWLGMATRKLETDQDYSSWQGNYRKQETDDICRSRWLPNTWGFSRIFGCFGDGFRFSAAEGLVGTCWNCLVFGDFNLGIGLSGEREQRLFDKLQLCCKGFNGGSAMVSGSLAPRPDNDNFTGYTKITGLQ